MEYRFMFTNMQYICDVLLHISEKKKNSYHLAFY